MVIKSLRCLLLVSKASGHVTTGQRIRWMNGWVPAHWGIGEVPIVAWCRSLIIVKPYTMKRASQTGNVGMAYNPSDSK